MIWDNDAIKLLTKLVKTDVPFSAIADILGCTRNAVIGKANRLGLQKHPTLIKIMGGVSKNRVEPVQPKPVVPVVIPVIQFEPGQVMMIDLKKNHCRYPFGDGEDIKFCGDTKLKESPYCKEHSDLCFAKTKPKVTRFARTF